MHSLYSRISTLSILHSSFYAFSPTSNPGNKNPSQTRPNLMRHHKQHLLPLAISAGAHTLSADGIFILSPANPTFLFPLPLPPSSLKGGQETSGLNLGKKISVPRDVMLEELSLLTNRGSKMFKLRQMRVEKFIYENHPDVFSDSSMVSPELYYSQSPVPLPTASW